MSTPPPPKVTLIHVRWEPIAGAERYEIAVNGTVVATAGPRARSSKLSVSNLTRVEITDLPARSVVQTVDFSQGDA